eukprot:1159608-Pelagomonas_calceolata.AAC.3
MHHTRNDRSFPSFCLLHGSCSFNHLMAFQMSGSADRVQFGPCDPNTLHPDLDWLESQLAGPHKPRMVVLAGPCCDIRGPLIAGDLRGHTLPGCEQRRDTLAAGNLMLRAM